MVLNFTNIIFVVVFYQTLQKQLKECLTFLITCIFNEVESRLTMCMCGFETHRSGLTATVGVRFPSTFFLNSLIHQNRKQLWHVLTSLRANLLLDMNRLHFRLNLQLFRLFLHLRQIIQTSTIVYAHFSPICKCVVIIMLNSVHRKANHMLWSIYNFWYPSKWVATMR